MLENKLFHTKLKFANISNNEVPKYGSNCDVTINTNLREMNSETRAISDNDVHVKKVTPLPKKKVRINANQYRAVANYILL